MILPPLPEGYKWIVQRGALDSLITECASAMLKDASL